MDEASYHRSLATFPSVVIAFFDRPESVPAALAELQALGLPARDVYVVGPTLATATPAAPPLPRGWFPRLNTAVHTALGQPQQTPAPRSPSGVPADELVVVVQALRLPAATIVALFQRRGARQVDSRGVVSSASQRANARAER